MAVKTHSSLNKLANYSWVYLVLYTIILVLTLAFSSEQSNLISYNFYDINSSKPQSDFSISTFKYNTIQSILSFGLAAALGIISIVQSGVLTRFYDKLKYFGITDVRINRKGQDPRLTSMWIDRINDSKDVTIVGTSSRGWFLYAKNELDDLLKTNNHSMNLKIFMLNPFGSVWKAKLDGYAYGYNIGTFIKQYQDVLETLIEFIHKYPQRVKIWFYDIDPISCVITDKYIYYALYLPLEARPEVPELKLEIKSDLGEKIYREVTEHLGGDKRKSITMDLDELKFYYEVLKKISKIDSRSLQKELIFSHVMTCDFCKEYNEIPSKYNNLYEENEIDFKPRVIKKYQDFYLLPTLGQMVDNYLLIVANKHVTGSSQLTKCQYRELSSIKETIKTINIPNPENPNQYTLFFEHGMPMEGIQCFGGCGISHLHIHAIPGFSTSSDDLFQELENFLRTKIDKIEVKNLTDWDDISNYRNFSYILVEYNNVVKAFLFHDGEFFGKKSETDKIPSQLLRLFVKEHLKCTTEYDWRKYKDEYTTILKVTDYYKNQPMLNI